ncbi:MAG: hypothetical protein QOF60_2901 [Actinomycetota bacterium]|jgi:hypothetical protein|nr:hypothetical protein [Actinomycetota bacterium]
MPTTPDRILARAAAELGTTESPPSSNSVKYNQWYYGRDERGAWCGAFVSWCFYLEDLPLPASTAKGFVYTPSGAAWFQKQGRWVPGNSGRKPEPGWVVFFDFAGDSVNRISHVGIVKAPLADGFESYEGNTDVHGGRTGGRVMLQTRRTGGVAGFGIPAYEISATPTPSIDIPAWEYTEDQMKTKMLEITTDGEGRGWAPWDPKLQNQRDPVIVGLAVHGPYPPADGYWEDAGEDVTLRAQPRDKQVIVSVVNGEPNSKVLVWVTVA